VVPLDARILGCATK